MEIDPQSSYAAQVETDLGTFTITFDPLSAPRAVESFVSLARKDFYNGVVFHRVIPGFVVQGGDPTGTGRGGPGYTFEDELPAPGAYKVGSVAMANAGPNTNGSQFFIVVGPNGESLPPNYTLFGQVTDGMEIVRQIEADGSPSGKPSQLHRMVSVTVTESPAQSG
ncbi:MAG: peptidylprolyl isomerase [Actinobacteria bacterium]|nr:peptidylprolyl isomerase [Actinomycetota bacterium]